MRQQRTELAAIEAEIVIAASFTDAWPRSPRRPIECIPQRARFLCGHLHFTFATRNMPSGTCWGPRNTALLGPEMWPETGPTQIHAPIAARSTGRMVRAAVLGEERQQTAGWYRRSLCVGPPMQGHHRGAHLGCRW
jgi:hypothetical protein